MTVAVVIPLFNGARWIEQTLASVAAQTLRPVEVVVVDDGSSDGSPGLAVGFPGVRVLRNPARGSNAARNYGLANTAAPLVAFLDHDDVWHPAHLATLVDVLKRHPGCPAAVGAVSPFADGGWCRFQPGWRGVRPLDPWARFPRSAAVGTPSAVLLRRDALDRVGGWSVEFTGTSDYHLWLRLSAGGTLLRAAAVTTGYRLHRASMSFEQRTSRVVEAMATRRRAAADALRYRLAVHPEGAEALSRRLRLADDAVRLAGAFRASDREAFRQAARGLERSVRDEPGSAARGVFIDLLWYFVPAVGFAEKAARARAVLVAWSKWWPGDAPRTGRVLRQLRWLASLARAAAPWWERAAPALPGWVGPR